MYNIKIIYSYDGSRFYGFQRQKDKITVQGEIEKVIKKVFKININLISSGRTDRNVHAIMQVSNFFVEKKYSIESIKNALNKHLENIRISSVEYVDNSFNARYSAIRRSYIYKLKKEVDIFSSKYISKIKDDIDINKFNNLAKTLVGTHNFQSFMKQNKDVTNYIRTIEKIKLTKKEDIYYLEIVANAFLQAMVRIITNDLLYAYYNNLSNNYLTDKLENNYLSKPKKLYNPSGLYLYKIEY